MLHRVNWPWAAAALSTLIVFALISGNALTHTCTPTEATTCGPAPELSTLLGLGIMALSGIAYFLYRALWTPDTDVSSTAPATHPAPQLIY